MIEKSVMQLLDGCVWQELGKNGKEKRVHIKPLWVWSALWKMWGKGDREEVYI